MEKRVYPITYPSHSEDKLQCMRSEANMETPLDAKRNPFYGPALGLNLF